LSPDRRRISLLRRDAGPSRSLDGCEVVGNWAFLVFTLASFVRRTPWGRNLRAGLACAPLLSPWFDPGRSRNLGIPSAMDASLVSSSGVCLSRMGGILDRFLRPPDLPAIDRACLWHAASARAARWIDLAFPRVR